MQNAENMYTRRTSHGKEFRLLGTVLALLSAAVPVLCATPAYADGDSSTPKASDSDKVSPNAYLTVAGGGSGIGFLGLASFTFDRGALQFSARASHAEQIAILSRPNVALTEYSLLAGGGKRQGARRLYAMAGIGYASITQNRPRSSNSWWDGSYDTSYNQTVNFPLQAGVAWDARSIGIGLALVGNVNPVYVDFGAVLTISLGRIR